MLRQGVLLLLQVTFISRRPTPQKRTVRLIDNEADVVAMLRALPGVDVHEVDLAALSLRQQLEIITSTDILIGRLSCKSCHSQAWASMINKHLQAFFLSSDARII